MSTQIVKNLEEEINGQKRKDIIKLLEEQLSENIEELSKNQIFFNLPLNNIFSVISKVDFDEIDEIGKLIEIIQNITKNIVKSHFEEKETILILQNLNTTTIYLSVEEIFSILELITNCPILVKLCHLYKEQNKLPEKDYEYELEQKELEIEKLKAAINNLNIPSPTEELTTNFSPITKQPTDYERNIFQACKKGKLTSVQWLIEKEGEDTNKREENIEWAPLHYSCLKGHLSIVQYLISKGANIEAKTKDEWTPLHYASLNGNLSVVEYLILKGANIEAKTKDEWTPLHYASEKGHLSIVEYLVSKGANIEAKTKDEWTPLHYSSLNGHLSIVEYLVSKGANIEEKTKDEWTPLHYSCLNGHLSIVQYLISKGANIEAQTKDEWTPLHYASLNGHISVVQYLISKGANIEAKTKGGKKPIDLTKNDEIRNILLSKFK